MTYEYPDLGSASSWLKEICYAARPIRSTIQVWVLVVIRHQNGLSALFPKEFVTVLKED